MANRIKGITLEINGSVTGLDKALKDINSQISKTGKQLKDVDRLLKLDPKNTELLSQKQRLLTDSINETKSKLDQLKEADKVAKQQLDSGDLGQDKYDAIQREMVETEEKLKGLQKEYKKFGDVASQQLQAVGKKMEETGTKIADVGKGMTAKVTAPIAALGAAAVKVTADFDEQMSKVQAISGATGDDMDKLREKARQMGADTKFSAAEAGEAMEYMAMAGWKTGDMLNGIEGIMNLAAASGEDLGTTSDIVTDALTAFGMKADEAGHFADILAAASSNANTNVSMLGESFKYAAPVAGAMGYTAEDVSVALGLMANAGIKASQGGTALRRLLVNMANPGKQAAEAMERLGISLDDGEGHMYSLREIMDQLRGSFGQINLPVEEFNDRVARLHKLLEDGEITEERYGKCLEELSAQAYGAEGAEKARAASMLAGANGMSGLLAIVNASEEDYNKLTGAIDNCGGSAKTMAEIMQDNLKGKITSLMAKLQELAISFGTIMMPAIEKATDFAQKLIDKLNGMDDGSRKMIITIAAVAAAIGPVLLVVGKTITTIGTLIKSIGIIKAALIPIMAGGAVPLGIIAAIAAIAIAIGVLIANWDTVVAEVKAMAEAVSQKWEEIKTKVSEAVQRAKETVQKNWEDIKTGTSNAFNTVRTTVTTVMENARSTIVSKATAATTAAKDKFNSMKTSIQNGLTAVVDAVKNKFESMKNSIKNKLDAAKDIVSKAVEKLKSLVNFKWSLPKLKTPHFKVEGEFDLAKLKFPKISVDWYQKAMDAAMILKNPTIFGYDQQSGRYLGGGEAGSEVVSGTDTLMGMIRQAVASVMTSIGSTSMGDIAASMQAARVSITYGDVNMTINGAPGQNVRELADIVADRIKDSYDKEKAVWA